MLYCDIFSLSVMYVFSYFCFFFFLMIRRPPRSTLFPYTTALPIWWRGSAQPLARDRRAYAATERRVQARPKRRPDPQTAALRCPHSRRESFRSSGQIACGNDRKRPPRPRVLQREARGGLRESDG